MLKRTSKYLFFILLVSLLQAQETDVLKNIKNLRLLGELNEARIMAENELNTKKNDPQQKIDIYLELAKIHDRIGLHTNTRPVNATLTNIVSASNLSIENDSLLWGEVVLEKGRYFYRAEMPDRKFKQAFIHTKSAVKIFQKSGNKYLEAEAVHLLGLIYLQQRELEKSRKLFDQSLALEKIGGERPYFLGDYERHVGFLLYLNDDTLTAVDYFKRSLEYRIKAGAIDHCMFAARILGTSLIQNNRLKEAKSALLYGLTIAELINSPVGKVRLGVAIGQLYEKEENFDEALIAYKMANKIALTINYASMVKRTTDALEKLRQ